MLRVRFIVVQVREHVFTLLVGIYDQVIDTLMFECHVVSPVCLWPTEVGRLLGNSLTSIVNM